VIPRRALLASPLLVSPLLASPLLASPLLAVGPVASAANPSWDQVERDGRGATVYFNAWGGDDRTNAFIAWAGERMRMLHGVTVRHVRLADTGEAVARVVAERAAGRTSGGSVDLIWINGPNFLAMKRQGLLYGPVLDRLPNAALIDRDKPTLVDFAEPTDGFEVPWRMARVVFVRDTAVTRDPPRSMRAMVAWAAAHPGRLTHPIASDFMGATFLKQALMELAPRPAELLAPVTDAAYAAAAAPLWSWYGALRPHLWRGGTDFPASGPAQTRLFQDGEIDLFISFNPAEAAVGIASGALPDTARAYVLDGGTLGNCSFVAVPFDAANPAAALLLANFLLSPEAQARAADPRLLGSPTVLALDRLSPADRARFAAFADVPGALTPAELGRPLPEPHASWMTRLAEDWRRRVTG
jgi:putative thiamine transport system substrate-binding protein